MEGLPKIGIPVWGPYIKGGYSILGSTLGSPCLLKLPGVCVFLESGRQYGGPRSDRTHKSCLLSPGRQQRLELKIKGYGPVGFRVRV